MESPDSIETYDAIIYHQEDEQEHAEKLCEKLRENIELAGNRSLVISTIEDFSHPGKTNIRNFDEALLACKYFLFSERLYEVVLGRFKGDVAIAFKQPHKFIILYFGNKKKVGSPSAEELPGIVLGENWDVSDAALRTFRKLFARQEDTAGSRTEGADMCDLSVESHLVVGNPSGAWSPRDSGDQQPSGATRLCDLQLTAVNPSLSSEQSESLPSHGMEEGLPNFMQQGRSSPPQLSDNSEVSATPERTEGLASTSISVELSPSGVVMPAAETAPLAATAASGPSACPVDNQPLSREAQVDEEAPEATGEEGAPHSVSSSQPVENRPSGDETDAGEADPQINSSDETGDMLSSSNAVTDQPSSNGEQARERDPLSTSDERTHEPTCRKNCCFVLRLIGQCCWNPVTKTFCCFCCK